MPASDSVRRLRELAKLVLKNSVGESERREVEEICKSLACEY